MSLTVAAIHDDSLITLVADTKVTWDGDEAKNRQTFANAMPKIVLLQQDVAVGVTGKDPDRVIEELVRRRDLPVEALLDLLARTPSAAFVVAALDPARLWMVADGDVDDRTEIRRAWAGDQSAYEMFQQRALEWPDGTETPFILLSSMQWLTSFNPVPSVGGYTLRAGSGDGRFGFLADQAWVGPWLTELVQPVDSQSVVLSVPPGGDSSTHHVLLLPGTGATTGALGIFIPETAVGLLFTHDRPWEAVRVDATDSRRFIESAFLSHKQTLEQPAAGFLG